MGCAGCHRPGFRGRRPRDIPLIAAGPPLATRFATRLGGTRGYGLGWGTPTDPRKAAEILTKRDR